MIVDQRLIDDIVNDMQIEIPLSFPLLFFASAGLLLYFVWYRGQ
jgi:hypothetical protein